jgi:GPH family glycoside/pentoside/hexuronide:cation symporter
MALTIGQKAGWGLADMGVVVFVVVKQLLIFTFLTTYLGVPAQTAGFVTAGVLVFDIVTDPIVGYLSDKTHSRWGRRAPWMAFGAVLMSVAMIAMFATPEGFTQTGIILWVSGFFGLATIGFTMVAIPYGAQAGEMTQDAKERSTMTGWRMGFASIGILMGGAVIPGLAQGMGFAKAAAAVAPLMIGAIWLSLYITRKAPRITQAPSVSFAQGYGIVFRNPAFMVLVVLYGVMTLAVALLTAGLPLAALYLMTDSGDTPLSGIAGALGLMSLLFAAFVLGSILSQAVWVMLSHRMGKMWALVVGLCLYAILLCVMATVLPSVSIMIMAGMFLCAGMTNGAYQQIPWAMYPDLMDVTRAKTGAAIEGAFSAVWLFGQKLANAAAPAALGVLLGRAGWQESTGETVAQTPEALAALERAMTVIPAGILLFSALGLVLIYRPVMQKILPSAET